MSYLHVSGTSGEGYATVPDEAALDITGDIDLRARFQPDTLSPSANGFLLAKYGSSSPARSFALRLNSAGNLTFRWYDSLGANEDANSTSLLSDVGIVAGDVVWVRTTYDVDANAGAGEVVFYYSMDQTNDPEGVSWTQLGLAFTPVGMNGDIRSGSESVSVGARSGDGAEQAGPAGFYRAALYNGIDGTKVLDIDFTNLTATELEAASFTCDTGQTVTLNGDEWAYPRLKTSLAGVPVTAYWDTRDGNKLHSPKLADRSGNNHHAQLGSTSSDDTNDPTPLRYAGERFVWLPGTGTNELDLGDIATFDAPAGGVRMKIDLELDDYSSGASQVLVFKRSGNDGYMCEITATGDLYARAGNGSDQRAGGLSPLTPFVDGQRYEIEVVFEVGVGWELFVDGVSNDTNAKLAAGEITGTATPLYVGSAGGSAVCQGNIFSASVAEFGGTLLADVNLADATEPFATFTERANGATVTINRSSSGYVSTVVDMDMLVLSTDDYLVVADHDDLDFGASDDFTLMIVARSHDTTPVAAGVLASKKVGLGTAAGYVMYLNTANGVYGLLGDGTVSPYDNNTAVSDGALTTAALVRNVPDDDVEVFLDGVGSGSAATDTTTATLANGTDFLIGAHGSPGSFFEGQFVAAALFRQALTDEQILAVSDALIGAIPSTYIHEDALQSWLVQNRGDEFTSTEIVGILNEINGTWGIGYAKSWRTFYGLD